MRSDVARSTYLYYRRARLDCGCHDPCRCDYRDEPTEKRVDGYRDAIEHLDAEGLCPGALTPELRRLWRRGGTDRKIANEIGRRWWTP